MAISLRRSVRSRKSHLAFLPRMLLRATRSSFELATRPRGDRGRDVDVEPDAAAFDEQIDHPAGSRKSGDSPTDRTGASPAARSAVRRPRRLRPRRTNRSWHCVADAPTATTSMVERVAVHAVRPERPFERLPERIVAIDADTKRRGRDPRSARRRPLDELDEVVEEGRLHLVFEAALREGAGAPAGQAGAERRRRATRPELATPRQLTEYAAAELFPAGRDRRIQHAGGEAGCRRRSTTRSGRAASPGAASAPRSRGRPDAEARRRARRTASASNDPGRFVNDAQPELVCGIVVFGGARRSVAAAGIET